MKKTVYFGLVIPALAMLSSCLGDDPVTSKEWMEKNDQWLKEKAAELDADGNPMYQRVGCNWDVNGYVLMRWHNDRTLTKDALSPISTSTIDVKYQVQTIDSVMIDNSYSNTTPADSIYRTQLNKNISGWLIGISQMHVGDSCTIIVPYEQGYGMAAYGSIPAYSNLIFNVKLTGIPYYQKES